MPTPSFRNGSAAQYPLPAGVVARLRFKAALTTFLANEAAARSDNERVNGFMSSPPTISYLKQATPGAEFGTGKFFYNATAGDLNAFGGGQWINAANMRFFINTTQHAGGTGGKDGAGHEARGWRVGGRTSSAKIAFGFTSGALPYRLIVDRQYVDLTGFSQTTILGNSYWIVDFGVDVTAKDVFLEGIGDANCIGLWLLSGEDITPIVADQHLIIAGDSIVAGTGPANQNDCWAQMFADRAGIKDVTRNGAGGGGWVADNAGNGLKLGDRLSSDILGGTLNRTPDLLMIAMGTNDISPITAGQITDRVVTDLTTITQAEPGLPVWVTGRLSSGDATSIAIENAIFAGVDAVASPWVIKIPIATAASPPSFTTADGTHPDSPGSIVIEAFIRPVAISAAETALAAVASL